MESDRYDVYNGNIEDFPDLEAPYDGYPSGQTWGFGRKDKDFGEPGFSERSAQHEVEQWRRRKKSKDRSLVITNHSAALAQPKIDSDKGYGHSSSVDGSALVSADCENTTRPVAARSAGQVTSRNVPSSIASTSVPRCSPAPSSVSKGSLYANVPSPSSSTTASPVNTTKKNSIFTGHRPVSASKNHYAFDNNNMPSSSSNSNVASTANIMSHSSKSTRPLSNMSNVINKGSSSTETRSTSTSKNIKSTSVNSRRTVSTNTISSPTFDYNSSLVQDNFPTSCTTDNCASSNFSSPSMPRNTSGSTSANHRSSGHVNSTKLASSTPATSSITNDFNKGIEGRRSESTLEDSFSPTHVEFLTEGDSHSALSYYYDILSNSILPVRRDKYGSEQASRLQTISSPAEQDLVSPSEQDLAMSASQELLSPVSQDLPSPASQEMRSAQEEDDSSDDGQSGSDLSGSDCNDEITSSILFLNRRPREGRQRTPSEHLIDNADLHYATINSSEALNQAGRVDDVNNQIIQASESPVGEDELNNIIPVQSDLRSRHQGLTRLSLSVTNPLYSSVVGLSDSSSENEAMAQSPSDCEDLFYSSAFESSSSSCQSRESLTNLKTSDTGAWGGSSNGTLGDVLDRHEIHDAPKESSTVVKQPPTTSKDLALGSSPNAYDMSKDMQTKPNLDSPREHKIGHKVNLGISSLKCTFSPAKEPNNMGNPFSGNAQMTFVPSINFERSPRMPSSKSEYQIREAESGLSQSRSHSRITSRPLSDVGPRLLEPISSKVKTKDAKIKALPRNMPDSLSSASELRQPLHISRSLSFRRRLSDPSSCAPQPPTRSASLGSTILLARSLSEPHLTNLNSYATDELRATICRLESEMLTIPPHITRSSNIPRSQGAAAPRTTRIPESALNKVTHGCSSSSSDTEEDTYPMLIARLYHSSSSDSFDVSLEETRLELPGLDSSDDVSADRPDNGEETLGSSDTDSDHEVERREGYNIGSEMDFSERVRIPAPSDEPCDNNGITTSSSYSDNDHGLPEVGVSDNYPGSSDSSSETMSVDALFTRLGIMVNQDDDADDEAGFQDSSDDEDEELLFPVRRRDSPHPAAYAEAIEDMDSSDSDGDVLPSIEVLYENLGIMTRQDVLGTSGSSIGPPRLPVRSSTDTDFLDFEILHLEDDSLEHPPSYLDLFPAGMASLPEMPPSYDDAVRPVSIHQDHFDYAMSHDNTAANNRLSLQLTWLPSSADYRDHPPPAYDEAIFCVQGRPHEEVSYQPQDADSSVRRSRGRRILNGLRRFARKIFK